MPRGVSYRGLADPSRGHRSAFTEVTQGEIQAIWASTFFEIDRAFRKLQRQDQRERILPETERLPQGRLVLTR